MSEDIVKTLLESLTDEQKAKLVEGLVAGMNQTVSKPPSRETEQEEAVSSKTKQTNKVREDFTVQREDNSRKTPVRAGKNKWVDDHEQFDNTDFDYSQLQRTPRQRKAKKRITVECSVCGKEFQKHESEMFGEYHRCNKCGKR